MGHPVVVFVHDRFEQAARAQAAGLRIADLKICVYPQYKPGDPLALEAVKASEALQTFQKLLSDA